MGDREGAKNEKRAVQFGTNQAHFSNKKSTRGGSRVARPSEIFEITVGKGVITKRTNDSTTQHESSRIRSRIFSIKIEMEGGRRRIPTS